MNVVVAIIIILRTSLAEAPNGSAEHALGEKDGDGEASEMTPETGWRQLGRPAPSGTGRGARAGGGAEAKERRAISCPRSDNVTHVQRNCIIIVVITIITFD